MLRDVKKHLFFLKKRTPDSEIQHNMSIVTATGAVTRDVPRKRRQGGAVSLGPLSSLPILEGRIHSHLSPANNMNFTTLEHM